MTFTATPRPYSLKQVAARYWRITDSSTGNISLVDPTHIAAIVFNSAEDAATVYIDLEVAGSGNQTIPVSFEVGGQDALDLHNWLEDSWLLEVDATPST